MIYIYHTYKYIHVNLLLGSICQYAAAVCVRKSLSRHSKENVFAFALGKGGKGARVCMYG